MRIDTIEQAIRDLCDFQVGAIEVVCSDGAEHQRRVESRANSLPNLKLPTWDEVVAREYHEWSVPRISIDTAGNSPESSYGELRARLTVPS